MSTYSQLIKQSTWLGRQINNVFGQDTFMGRTFGESNATAAENFFAPSKEELAARRQAAAEYDARQAAINARIDRGIAQANQRLAQGQGITQRAVAAKPAAPAAQTRIAPPPTAAKAAPRPTPQAAFNTQANPATRSAAGARNLAASDAVIRARDAAKVTGRPNPYRGMPR